MFKCLAFYSTLCPFCAIHNGSYTSMCKTAKKKRMEARTMLGSCCIHDRPDIDTYLAYLDMYTDYYIHIYMYIYISISISISIYPFIYIYRPNPVSGVRSQHVLHHITTSLQPHPRPNPICGVRSQHVLHHITTSLQPHPRPNPICGVRSQHVLHHITTSLQPHPRPNPICGYLWRKITTCLTSTPSVA